MSVDKFKFVSPGIFVKEIDKSEIPGISPGIGPVIIGRTEKGPAFRPTMVQSMEEYVQIFGDPIPGGRGGDVWRNGNYSSPTYTGYAARAYLKNNGPVTIVRVLGVQDPDAAATSPAEGAAGWKIHTPTTDPATNGGAYGLFLTNKPADEATQDTGVLAAIWYTDNTAVSLSGRTRVTNDITSSNATFIQSTAAKNKEFKLNIGTDEAGVWADTYTFNFDPSSDNYIRKAFNTNPIKTNPSLNGTATTASYWLGETFDRAVADTVTGDNAYGIILALQNSTANGADFMGTGYEAAPAETGYFISQDLSTSGDGGGFRAQDQTELFKLVGLSTEGEHLQRSIKVSITNIKDSVDDTVDPYGTFSIEIREIGDTDSRKKVLERYDNLNLNPNSPQFVSAVIGDRYIAWDASERRYKEHNDYPNNSKLVRVQVASALANGGIAEASLPFGVKGPLKFQEFTIVGTNNADAVITATNTMAVSTAIVGRPNAGIGALATQGVDVGNTAIDWTCTFPSIPLRAASISPESFSDHKKAYFGVDLFRKNSAVVHDSSVVDLVRVKPAGVDNFVTSTTTEHQYVFTLDDIVGDSNRGLDTSGDTTHVRYTSGSHADGTSLSHMSGGHAAVLARGIDKFTTVMHGGHDGLNITEADPFRNSILDGTDTRYGSTTTTNYARASFERALEVISDPDEMDFNLAVMPGVTNEALTQRLADICEDRADALAVIDPKGGYEPAHEGPPETYPKLGSVADTVSNMKSRSLNSSYACAYYPWVQTKDSSAGQLLWLPPSVVALGTMGSSAANSELWFAPAGFNRGGLSEGSAGISVISAREKLTSNQRDDLYENRINPIASFPSEGLVIFGQKTTQIKSSALDRINVRRLMIFLKKEISRIANGILFDQNTEATWNRFRGPAEKLLSNVRTNFGLEDYKLILDETTTTPDLRDRNIMYAKILLKPAKSIEFIALDFTIMNSGAAFDD
tara:strand:+ start:18017 stop:20926 length:2910 start_codon:yes stop_codon:yes gene_type:complete